VVGSTMSLVARSMAGVSPGVMAGLQAGPLPLILRQWRTTWELWPREIA
jgi:hypothetical protein